jgi:serine/threonine protein kinase
VGNFIIDLDKFLGEG